MTERRPEHDWSQEGGQPGTGGLLLARGAAVIGRTVREAAGRESAAARPAECGTVLRAALAAGQDPGVTEAR